jgi:iron complex transport system substrate-binding protein
MRIASLVPSATEMLFALGLGDSVVAVTHECDYPPAARELPHLTSSVIGDGLGPAEIDAAVREVTGRGEALYELDEGTLRELEPDLIVTQAVCDVCAVSYEDVRAVAERLPGAPDVLSLDPSLLGEVLGDVETLAAATGIAETGACLRAELERRLATVAGAVADAGRRPRLLALEWLSPPFIGGHWVPEMIRLAGGEDPIGEAGVDSRTVRWGALAAARPDVVVVMPCGLDAEASARQAEDHAELLAGLGARKVWAVDAAATFSRPGPRLVEGVELLGHLLHPDRVGPPAGIEWSRIEVGA